MSERPLQIAVVGHTNTGKTSLMRTLTRRRDFGEVSARPATTRHVEMARITMGGDTAVELYDTPGLEDSTGLLGHLDDLRQREGTDWTGAIDAFVAEEDKQAAFGQEAKALAQLRGSDVALYVIDARDPVRAKNRDELEILSRSAVPVLPVLNFTAQAEARADEWRDALARTNMHAVVAFDTVVFDAASEIALYRKIATLLDRFAPAIDRLVTELSDRRRQIRRASAGVIADMLIDVAAARRTYPTEDEAAEARTAEDLKDAVREREATCVRDLIALHDFDESDYAIEALPVHHGAWEEDPFDPETLARYGLSAGRAAAAGAAAGLAVDLMVGGVTLGAAAATGAAVGFFLDTARHYGSRWMESMTGKAALRVDDATIQLLAARETALAGVLLHRGHGAVSPIRSSVPEPISETEPILRRAGRARRHPDWSALNRRGSGAADSRRQELTDMLAREIESRLDNAPQDAT